jgi:hypothetical protein
MEVGFGVQRCFGSRDEKVNGADWEYYNRSSTQLICRRP